MRPCLVLIAEWQVELVLRLDARTVCARMQAVTAGTCEDVLLMVRYAKLGHEHGNCKHDLSWAGHDGSEPMLKLPHGCMSAEAGLLLLERPEIAKVPPHGQDALASSIAASRLCLSPEAAPPLLACWGDAGEAGRDCGDCGDWGDWGGALRPRPKAGHSDCSPKGVALLCAGLPASAPPLPASSVPFAELLACSPACVNAASILLILRHHLSVNTASS